MNRIDALLSKSAGKVKSVKARIDGLVGIFRILAEQHGQVTVLLHRLQQHPHERVQRWPEIRRELLAHERGETRELYPMIREMAALRHLADNHDDEATEIEHIIDELDDLRDPVSWQELYGELVAEVVHHASEEERAIFPQMQRAIGERCAKDLEQRVLAVQRTVASAV